MINVSNLDGVEDVLTGTIAGNPLDPAESHMVDAIQAEDRYFNILKAFC